MKKSIFTIAIILSVFTVLLSSCNKDETEDLTETSGKYKLVMDGNTVAEGTSEEVGMLSNNVSISQGEDFGILLTNVPENVGGEVELGTTDAQSTVSITGKNLLKSNSDEMYFAISGSIKRVSSGKITFEGQCTELGSTTVHTFSGSIESDVFKTI